MTRASRAEPPNRRAREAQRRPRRARWVRTASRHRAPGSRASRWPRDARRARRQECRGRKAWGGRHEPANAGLIDPLGFTDALWSLASRQPLATAGAGIGLIEVFASAPMVCE